ncbi:MAG: hypothetical protein RID91_18025 [Azospirillaceae bacterium]
MTAPARLLVVGGGVTALAVARRLAALGHVVDRADLPGPSAPPGGGGGPPLLLNDAALALIAELFGASVLDRLPGHRIAARRVAWAGAEPVVRDQAALTIRSGALRAALADTPATGPAPRAIGPVPAEDGRALEAFVAGYVGAVDATGGTAALARAFGAMRWPLGRRAMVAAEAVLSDDAPGDTARIETVGDGWLFLAPLGGGRAALQLMAARRPEDLLAALVGALGRAPGMAGLIADAGPPAVVDAAPAWTEPPVRRPDFLPLGLYAVGEAAAAFDPVSGEGVPAALRGALLAAACLDAAARGRVPAPAAAGHYADRLALSLGAHLDGCRSFYTEAFGDDSAWAVELAAGDPAVLAAPAPEDLGHTLQDGHLVPASGP